MTILPSALSKPHQFLEIPGPGESHCGSVKSVTRKSSATMDLEASGLGGRGKRAGVLPPSSGSSSLQC